MPTPSKLDDVAYIQFLIAAQTTFTCTEAARCYGAQEQMPAHDAFTRLLARRPPDTEALWAEVAPHVNQETGVLILDDSTLDKPHARHMELVTRHWSGKHQRVVLGINLLTLLWTEGEKSLPLDCRISDPASGQNKNEAFRAMLTTARERALVASYVLFDSWYSGLDNLKHVRKQGWHWLTRLKSNRQVNPDDTGNLAVADLDIPEEGRLVHLRGYGFIRVFRVVLDFDEAQHWATDDLDMTQEQRQQLAGQSFEIENYHRGLKQCCGVERCQARKANAQMRHILLSIRAFVRLELRRCKQGISWYESKIAIVRDAIRHYLAAPTVLLPGSA